MSEKTKKLLDKLSKITEDPAKPKWQPPPPTIPDTNRMWKSVHDSGISPLPKSYEPIKWEKEVDADGVEDYWRPYDRVYGGLSDYKLINKDGTTYEGKLTHKYRLLKGHDGKNFKSRCTVSADGRWFDNGGMPIDPPTIEIATQEEETNEEENN